MSAIEIICGVILIAVAAVIIFLTLVQESKGQGLGGAINGVSDMMSAGRSRGIDAKMANITKICGVVFFVVAVVVSIVSARLG